MKVRFIDDTTLAPPKLVIHSDSHAISKQKPKVRIIHIVAPEVIKTDVHNFRELVQQLTGKQGNAKKQGKHVSSLVAQAKAHDEETKGAQRMKKEIEEVHRGISNPFFSFFGEVDGFIHDMHEFPLLPFKSPRHLC